MQYIVAPCPSTVVEWHSTASCLIVRMLAEANQHLSRSNTSCTALRVLIYVAVSIVAGLAIAQVAEGSACAGPRFNSLTSMRHQNQTLQRHCTATTRLRQRGWAGLC
jgi:hypothetical protein